MRTLRDADVKGKKVLIRFDYNVPLKDGVVEDDARLQASVPTINYLLGQGCALILTSHLGRPKGKVVEELRLEPVARRLSEILGKSVEYVKDTVGKEAKGAAASLKPGHLLLLENVQFHPGEQDNSEEYGKELASMADIFVLEAFGQAHRDYASLTKVEKFLPSYAGFILEKEVTVLRNALERPERPLVVIIGGVKISTKLGALKNMLRKVDYLLIGGAMVFTFLKAQGKDVGTSLVEDDQIEAMKGLLENERLVLPTDIVVADNRESREGQVVRVDDMPDDKIGLDIGPATIELFKEKLEGAKTVIWNGPMGLFENNAFSSGTTELAKLVAKSGAVTIVGGGDTVAAVRKAGVEGKYTHVSTGGGAMVEFLEGKTLPAIAALESSQ